MGSIGVPSVREVRWPDSGRLSALLDIGPRISFNGGWDSKVIMLIMFARTLNDHLGYADVGGLGRHVGTKARRHEADGRGLGGWLGGGHLIVKERPGREARN